MPDPVWLPQNLPSGQAATQLIQELLKGPTSRLGNGVVSLAPPGTEVQLSVPVDLGVATVALNDTAGSLRDQDRRQLAAQIVWTLNQLNLRARSLSAAHRCFRTSPRCCRSPTSARTTRRRRPAR